MYIYICQKPIYIVFIYIYIYITYSIQIYPVIIGIRSLTWNNYTYVLRVYLYIISDYIYIYVYIIKFIYMYIYISCIYISYIYNLYHIYHIYIYDYRYTRGFDFFFFRFWICSVAMPSLRLVLSTLAICFGPFFIYCVFFPAGFREVVHHGQSWGLLKDLVTCWHAEGFHSKVIQKWATSHKTRLKMKSCKQQIHVLVENVRPQNFRLFTAKPLRTRFERRPLRIESFWTSSSKASHPHSSCRGETTNGGCNRWAGGSISHQRPRIRGMTTEGGQRVWSQTCKSRTVREEGRDEPCSSNYKDCIYI